MKKRLNWDNPKDLELIITALKGDEIIAGTSDTVIGLLAQADEKTYAKLNVIKKRYGKSYLLLVNLSTARKFLFETIFNENIKKLAQAFWPGPLTLIVRAGKSAPSHLKSLKNTIALRVPDHKGIQEILEEMPMLFSTSANISGKPIPKSVEAINPIILDHVSYVVENEYAPDQSKPSTIVDCSGDTCEIVREGAIAASSIKKVLG